MTEKINEILCIDDVFKAPPRLIEILLDKNLRETIFHQFLELFNHKLDEDFWHVYFQEEAAQRKKQKQDFTPMSVASLVSKLTETSNNNGMRYEATAGTGGMTIARWNLDRLATLPWDYKPSQYLYICEELSDRAFPFLVFNMAIRGMNGAAIHCDALTRECYGVFFISNGTNNPNGFSSVNVMPYSREAEDYFKIKFIAAKYPAHVESPSIFGSKGYKQ